MMWAVGMTGSAITWRPVQHVCDGCAPAEWYRSAGHTETSTSQRIAEKKNATHMRGVLSGVPTGIRTPVLTVKG
jgi:hypothetical protein